MRPHKIPTPMYLDFFSMHPKLGGNETDRMALLAIKAQIKEDPDQFLSSWNESYHFCLWQGVTCSQRHHQRITRLNLGNQNLVGTISPHIGNLSFLRVLRLSDNRLSGQIPPEIGRLRRLQVLNLTQNSLSGVIPVNMSNCLDLIGFHSGFNHLVGKIPIEFGSFPKLEKLVLQRNTLSGAIPDSLGNISSLDVFAFYDNHLSGDIPSSLGQLKKLRFFSLGSNKLSGIVPPSIYNLSNLAIFSIAFNSIQGTIPRELATIFPNLKVFHITGNQFSGSIPISISNATNLVQFEVLDNKLTGQVPNLQKLCNLETLLLDSNRLGTGTNGDLSNATKFRWLVTQTNNFGGVLPTAISNLSTTLEILWVGGNQLYGNIPARITSLVSLE
ncbi:putative receptor-like protein kinase At3g47110 [Malus sylvestris]|uniref:putative receptor-like protein kinase At3g47110 n=1 Tax=Malus sylvestris TaxID=3752 RepID=UPI0021ABFA2C|nr:putative receptor-like protein kinase At3g47110 [Malus sylvestris]